MSSGCEYKLLLLHSFAVVGGGMNSASSKMEKFIWNSAVMYTDDSGVLGELRSL